MKPIATLTLLLLCGFVVAEDAEKSPPETSGTEPSRADLDKRLKVLLEKLGSEEFEERSRAEKAIVSLGRRVRPLLKKHVTEDPEVQLRIQRILVATVAAEDVGSLKEAVTMHGQMVANTCEALRKGDMNLAEGRFERTNGVLDKLCRFAKAEGQALTGIRARLEFGKALYTASRACAEPKMSQKGLKWADGMLVAVLSDLDKVSKGKVDDPAHETIEYEATKSLYIVRKHMHLSFEER